MSKDKEKITFPHGKPNYFKDLMDGKYDKHPEELGILNKKSEGKR